MMYNKEQVLHMDVYGYVTCVKNFIFHGSHAASNTLRVPTPGDVLVEDLSVLEVYK